ncbi:hypothetical protein SAMN06298224_0750 [Fibrobacter sp. UWB16]|nr:hypothetical protein SAMN06298224_0750 [Fibrobacter sp. UWB16]
MMFVKKKAARLLRAAVAIFRAFPGTSRRIPIVLSHISSSRISLLREKRLITIVRGVLAFP